MSEEQLKAFVEAVKADAGLQEKLKTAGDVDAVVAIAKVAGFAVTADELKKVQSKISDENLKGVEAAGEREVFGGPMVDDYNSNYIITSVPN